MIGECHASGIDEEVALKYRSVNGSQDRELFAEFCLHLMLYRQSSQGSGTKFIIRAIWSFKSLLVRQILFSYSFTFSSFIFYCRGGCSPGLSIAQSNRVAGKNPLKNEELLMRKVKIEAEYHLILEIIDICLGFQMRCTFFFFAFGFSWTVRGFECCWRYGAGSRTCLSPISGC